MKKIKVLIIADSLGMPRPRLEIYTENTYPSILENLLPKIEFKIITRRALTTQRMLEDELLKEENITPKEYDLLILQLGVTEGLRFRRFPIKKTLIYIRQFVKEFSKVILIDPPFVKEKEPWIRAESVKGVRKLQKNFKKLSFPIVSLYDFLKEHNEYMLSDNMHLNTEGSKVFAHLLANKIVDVLNLNKKNINKKTKKQEKKKIIKSVKIKDKVIGKKHPTFLIGEMACAHQGVVDQAIKLVEVAKNSNVDAIQLQIFKKEKYISPRHKDYELVSNLELSFIEWKKVIKKIKKLDMIFFGAGYDTESVRFLLRNNVDAFKIHSSDIQNLSVMREVGRSKKPVFLSCGASSLSEIEKAIIILQSYGTEDIILMHGFQAYPTKIKDTHLAFIKKLEETFNLNVGFYDHVDANSILSTIIPIMSIGYGAQVIEKHFTLNRKLKLIDHESSFNPNELKKFHNLIRESEKVIGLKEKDFFTKDEKKYRENIKKSLVYINSKRKGSIIDKKDMIPLRSYVLGITPNKDINVIGATLKKDVKKYDNVNWNDFK